MKVTKESDELITLIRETSKTYTRETVADAIGCINASKEQIDLCVKAIYRRFEVLRSHVRHELDSYALSKLKAVDKLEYEEHARESREKIKANADKERILTDRKYRLEPMTYDWSQYKGKVLVEGLFFVCEIGVNAYGVATLGGALGVAFVVAIVIAIGLCVVSIFIGREYKKRQGQDRKSFAIKSAIGMAIVLGVLSILRSIWAFANGEMHFDSSVIGGTAIYFVINAFLFFAATVFGTTLPTDEDRSLKQQHDQVDKELAACKSAIELEQKSASSKRAENSTKVRERIAREANAQYYDTLITGYCEEAVLSFWRELSLRNPDFKQDNILN
ncbi:MAG: hypothetical protein JSS76_16300 [Bacteroidetes bacterium]|nr:hypothetical protein [Bacteroidota bacterium]